MIAHVWAAARQATRAPRARRARRGRDVRARAGPGVARTAGGLRLAARVGVGVREALLAHAALGLGVGDGACGACTARTARAWPRGEGCVRLRRCWRRRRRQRRQWGLMGRMWSA
eukprot:6882029-Prymnesium_polylepis.1